jgi:hypothetical protein
LSGIVNQRYSKKNNESQGEKSGENTKSMLDRYSLNYQGEEAVNLERVKDPKKSYIQMRELDLSGSVLKMQKSEDNLNFRDIILPSSQSISANPFQEENLNSSLQSSANTNQISSRPSKRNPQKTQS